MVNKHVHIAIVGGQPVPVYIGIKTALEHDVRIDRIVLVCSSDSRPEAIRIMNQFPKYDSDDKRIILECSPVDFIEIEQLVWKLKKEYKEWEKIYVNLTSGTKPWALSFASILGPLENVHIIYVEQANLITNIKTKATLQGEISPQTRFELYGAKPNHYYDLEKDFTQKDKLLVKAIEKIRSINTYDFSILTNNINIEELREGEYFGNDKHFIDYFFDETRGLDYCTINCKAQSNSTIFYYFKENKAVIQLIKKDGSIFNEGIQSEHLLRILFNSSWFELKTALELKQNSKVKTVWLNLTIQRMNSTS